MKDTTINRKSANAGICARYVGRVGVWCPAEGIAKGLRVDVQVVDASAAYGRIRLLVQPVSGTGQAWVSAHTVEVEGIETPAWR